MSLIPNGDQRSPFDTMKRSVAHRGPLSKVHGVIASDQAYYREVRTMNCHQLGPASLAISDEYRGVGGRAFLATALRELGAGLLPSSLLASTALAAGTLLSLDDEAERKERK
jgi:hypothetical protein